MSKYIFWGICIHVYVSVWVSRVSGPLSMVTATPGCQHQGKDHFSLHLQWHGMPNTPNGSWEIVHMEHSCLFLFFAPLELFFTHIPTYVTCGGWIRECEYVHSDVNGPQGPFVSVFVVSILLLECHLT